MKTIISKTLILLSLVVLASSCSATLSVGPSRNNKAGKTIPPGQLKKMTGEQSAAKYAPGHNK